MAGMVGHVPSGVLWGHLPQACLVQRAVGSGPLQAGGVCACVLSVCRE